MDDYEAYMRAYMHKPVAQIKTERNQLRAEVKCLRGALQNIDAEILAILPWGEKSRDDLGYLIYKLSCMARAALEDRPAQEE